MLSSFSKNLDAKATTREVTKPKETPKPKVIVEDKYVDRFPMPNVTPPGIEYVPGVALGMPPRRARLPFSLSRTRRPMS